MSLLPPKQILVVGPAWIGDMVMSQSLYKLLRAQNPAVKIDVLAPAWSKPLLDRMSEVNQAIALPFQHGELNLSGRYQLGKQLRASNYQQAILLPNSFKSALVPFWANIPKRTGWLGESRWGLLNDARRLDKTGYPLMVQRFSALAYAKNETLPIELPSPELTCKAASIENSLKAFSLENPTQPVLGLCPGAEYGSAKRWPVEYYAEVAKQKIGEGWQVWLFGSAKESELALAITQELTDGYVDLTGKTTLAQAIDLMSVVTAVVTNDSGLMHVAASLGRPLVALYGSSDPSFTPPLSETAICLSERLDCSPCFKRDCPLQHFDCMRRMTPEKVLSSLNRLPR